jgi:hypothetical protein
VNPQLSVLSYALSGVRNVSGLERRSCPLPPPGLRHRHPRLPGLAAALAERALEGSPAPPAAVFCSTGLGCSTETEAFVENMILKREAAPMPRAFSVSVHNAVASRIAIRWQAHGEILTFVHAETSVMQALLAAAGWSEIHPNEPLLAGGVDEFTPYIERGRRDLGCEVDPEAREGGAVLLCGRPVESMPALARVSRLALGRTRDVARWLEGKLPEDPVDLMLVAPPAGTRPGPPPIPGPRALDARRWTGDHPSSAASATALAVALLAGEVDPEVFSLAARPRAVAVVARTRFHDAGLIVLEAAA